MTTSKEMFRIATAADTDRCWQILQQGKAQMMREGKHQWTNDYPVRANVEQDILNHHAYVLQRGNTIIAYGAVIKNGEPAYDQITDKWLSHSDYIVLHRLAVADEAKRQGVAARYFQYVEQFAVQQGIHSFKIDTNYDNFYMLHIMIKLGFSLCGEITYPQGTRLAFEKLL